MQNKITKVEAFGVISEITRAMNQSENPEEVLDQILSACMEVSDSEAGNIMLLDRDRKTLVIRVSRGFVTSRESWSLKVGEGITGWVARAGKPRIVNDASLEPDYIPLQEGFVSELVVPMVVKDEVIGVISVDSTHRNTFTEEHQEFLSIMANLSARLFVYLNDNHLLKIRDRFHGVMMKISKILSHSLNLETIFEEIMGITEKAFKLHRSTLFLYNHDEDVLKVVATVGLEKNEALNVAYHPGEGITGTVFLNKKSVFIPNVKNDPYFLNRMRMVAADEDMGYFSSPIFSGTEVVGVFATFTQHQSGVDPEFILEFLEVIGSIISQAITIQKLVEDEKKVITYENIQLKQELSGKYQFGKLVGKSPLMTRLFEKVRIIAESRASVLLTGESGTGKELIASAIHYNSPRRDKPFVKINCAAIPENLMESELFGHRKGSFTGAIADKKGKFEISDGGTIFLDEIGELNLNLQSKLLRVLQEREIEPVGGRTRQVDIRVIAATNANLEEKIQNKEFRSDLYYRLNVITLEIPALRERREDILPLLHHFLEKYNKENGKAITGFAPDAIALMENFDWPGNVRQLENVVERAVVLSRNEVLTAADFQDSTLPMGNKKLAGGSDIELRHEGAVSGDWPDNNLPPEEALNDLDGKVYDTVISEVERRLIVLALKKFRYTKTQAARFLGINRNTLDKKIKELSIDY